MKCSVFCGISVDGFLARPNHKLDFLHGTGEGGPLGFHAFYNSVDVVVIGRKTFEVVRGFGGWFYGKKPVVVLSRRKLDFSKLKGAVIQQMSGRPADVVKQLEKQNFEHAYIDGGITIQRFLAAGLIDRMTVTRVPVLIGKGIPLFGSLAKDIRLEHVRTRSSKGGAVQTQYNIAPVAKKSSSKSKAKKARAKAAGRK
ncbi:MAG TPA: dihydrofolate reductase family protein [Terriglobales bacterium]|nr:dihydrofolate reductase family protein [Terriglobales bacterium]